MRKESGKERGARGKGRLSALLTVALFCAPTALLAQAPEQFEVIKGAPTESLPAAPLVFFGYAFVWVVVFLYIAMLWKRLSRVENEVRDLSTKHPAPLAPRH